MFVDSHCHLDKLDYQDLHTSVEDVVNKAKAANVLLNISTVYIRTEYIKKMGFIMTAFIVFIVIVLLIVVYAVSIYNKLATLSGGSRCL